MYKYIMYKYILRLHASSRACTCAHNTMQDSLHPYTHLFCAKYGQPHRGDLMTPERVTI